jgi:hypothetical protein
MAVHPAAAAIFQLSSETRLINIDFYDYYTTER